MQDAAKPPLHASALSFPVGQIGTAGDAVTQRLREAIVFAELPPGTRLRQEELARHFGTSRVPLREAMRQLTAEGLIDWPSNRSAVVRSLDVEELQELFELGALLEKRATALGVPRLTDQDLDELHRLQRAQDAPGLPMAEWYRINLAFHLLPMLRSGQRHTLQLVTAIRLNLTRHFLLPDLYQRADGDWHDKHHREHAALLAAFERRDAAAARKLVEQHWRSTWADWRPQLEAHLKTRNKSTGAEGARRRHAAA